MTDNDKENFACAFDLEFSTLFLRAFGEREADEHQLAVIEWAWTRVASAWVNGYKLGQRDGEVALNEAQLKRLS